VIGTYLAAITRGKNIEWKQDNLPKKTVKKWMKNGPEKFYGETVVTPDYFTSFVSSGPKSYAMKSKSGKSDVCKSKGFYLHYGNKKIFNFDSLKKQVLAKSLGEQIAHLVLHKDETIMRRNLFRIVVERNKGKQIKMVYDKREIVPPTADEDGVIRMVDTLPHGHIDLLFQHL